MKVSRFLFLFFPLSFLFFSPFFSFASQDNTRSQLISRTKGPRTTLLLELYSDDTLLLFHKNYPDGKLKLIFNAGIYDVFLSPGEKYLVINFKDSVSFLYSIKEDMTLESAMRVQSSTGLFPHSFSSEGKFLALVQGHKINIFDLQTKKLVQVLRKTQTIERATYELEKQKETREELRVVFEKGGKETLSLRRGRFQHS